MPLLSAQNIQSIRFIFYLDKTSSPNILDFPPQLHITVATDGWQCYDRETWENLM